MQHFKIRPGGFSEIRKKQLIKSIPILLIAATMGIVISSVNSKAKETDINTLPIIIPLILGALGFGIYRGINRQKSLFDSYTLSIGKNLIRRQQLNTPEISIYFNDILEISKSRNGNFTIKGKTASEIIIIPSQIKDYDQLEQLLNQIKPVTKKASDTIVQKYAVLISLLTLGLMATVYIVKDKILVAVSGVVLVGILSWSFYELQRNKNIDNKTKQGSWLVLLVIASIIAVMFFKLTAFY